MRILCLPGDDLLSQSIAQSLSSTLTCFTSLFEMGRGGSKSHKSPDREIFDIQILSCLVTLKIHAPEIGV